MPTETLIAPSLNCAPTLTAKLAPWMRGFIQQPELAQALVPSADSPVHIVVASEFIRNVSSLKSALSLRGVSGGLYFARKANKLPWFVTLAKEQGIGVDTASLNELKETLALGVDPARIIVTAVGKTPELVSLAVSTGCLLVIENTDEIEMIGAAVRSLNRAARVGLRFSGFTVNGRDVYSRFGLPIEQFPSLLARINSEPHMQVELLHAHLDRYDTHERAAAAMKLLEVADHARANGQAINSIDLGGGILIRYLDAAEQWQEFLNSLVAAVAGDRPSFTFMGEGFGFHKTGDQVVGNADLYPMWNELSKERFLSAVLDQDFNGIPLHKQISERGVNLYFEPGRALLDNVGITLARVAYRKLDTLGNQLIGLGMNRMNLRPFRAEFCVDPILLAKGARDRLDTGAFLVGNLCGEGDFIMRRRLNLDRMPQLGDIICFPNTAGYLAHHMEIGTHGAALPVNLLMDEQTWEVRQTFGS